MIDIATTQVGDKVHYIGFEGAIPENGIIKEIPIACDGDPVIAVRVVYYCNDDWDKYQNYTSALTRVKQLYKGWSH